MIIPIGDSPNPPFTPWATWMLIGVNVLIFIALLPLASQGVDPADPSVQEYLRLLAVGNPGDWRTLVQQVSAYDLVVFEHGARPGALEFSDLLTAMFLHGGFAHLAGNMLFLWIYGDNVEFKLGHTGFLLFYVGAGIAATFGDALLRWGSDVPTVGASGAISGVLGAYFLWFPHNRVRLWVFFFPFIMRVVQVGARWVLGAYVVFDNLLPLLLSGGSGGVSHGAHLGGFLAGVVVAGMLRRAPGGQGERTARRDDDGALPADPLSAKPRPPAPPAGQRARGRQPTRPSSLWASLGFGGTEPSSNRAHSPDRELHHRLRAGDWDGAAALFFSLPAGQLSRLSPADVLLLAQSLERDDRSQAAAAVYERLVSTWQGADEAIPARLGMARLLLVAFERPSEAWQLAEEARRLSRTGADNDEALRLLKLCQQARSSSF
ncbi:MAG: rhomboid family intramembrane serine protease [Myxococcales bacterium]|nr:rhomboid family intramembrane serine protease [Myxococcales bacterium]